MTSRPRNAAIVTGPEDPLIPAIGRVLSSWAAMLHGYRLDPDQEIHALRILRSVLRVDDGFTCMLGFVDQGLTAKWPDLIPVH